MICSPLLAKQCQQRPAFPGGGKGVLGLIFAGYVPLVSQSPYPIIIYSVANYRPHLSHFWGNSCDFRDPNLVTFYFYL